MQNEIIVVKQLPVIQEQLKLIKAEVTKKVDFAKNLVCTEETVKDVKKVRADLNADFKTLEDKRKEVKKAIMTPYEQFESVYKENISDVFKQADADLKGKIDEVENGLKEQKRIEVVEYFNEYITAKNIDFVKFEDLRLNITLSASLKSLKKTVADFIDKVCGDLALIETQEHKAEILVEYKQSLDVSSAILNVTARKKAIAEEQARAEERKAAEQVMQEAENKIDELLPPTVADPITPPVVEESTYKMTFTVKGTKAQLQELKNYMIQKGIEIL